MGIRTVMITGDNQLTAAAIAAEAGVDDFLAEATPEDKMTLIKREQGGGRLAQLVGQEQVGRDGFEAVEVELEVFEYNERAIAAYKNCGFVEDAQLRLAHFSDGAFHDALIMAVLRSDFDAGEGARAIEEVTT